jgi:hypothetical protein
MVRSVATIIDYNNLVPLGCLRIREYLQYLLVSNYEPKKGVGSGQYEVLGTQKVDQVEKQASQDMEIL